MDVDEEESEASLRAAALKGGRAQAALRVRGRGGVC
jgi:hypothetical protein